MKDTFAMACLKSVFISSHRFNKLQPWVSQWQLEHDCYLRKVLSESLLRITLFLLAYAPGMLKLLFFDLVSQPFLTCFFFYRALNDPRGQQLKLGHPAGMVQQNLIQGQQQTRIVQQIPGNRIIQTVANPNQPGQAPVGQSVLHQQLQQPTQQPAGAVPVSVPGQPPPPPYPEPPPPYPGSQSGAMPGAPAVNQVSNCCRFWITNFNLLFASSFTCY